MNDKRSSGPTDKTCDARTYRWPSRLSRSRLEGLHASMQRLGCRGAVGLCPQVALGREARQQGGQRSHARRHAGIYVREPILHLWSFIGVCQDVIDSPRLGLTLYRMAMVSVTRQQQLKSTLHISELLKSRRGIYSSLVVPDADITSTQSPHLHFSIPPTSVPSTYKYLNG